ncbi:MAG TPA: hypothetical protein VFF50_07510 [Candidatus Deferrimicrobiaceae bacterium]|jgi:hypothetical protein|nr:hypothetical protein [Candidatus Deferrimicrobiaceae bacterium]
MIAPTRSLVRCFLIWVFLAGWSTSAQTVFPEVSTSGGLSSHSIHEDESLQFTISIQNRADAKKGVEGTLHHLTLVALPDSYSLLNICVAPQSPSLPERCQSREAFEASNSLVAETIAPGQGVSVRGYLKPGPTHKAATLTALIAWTVYSSAQPSSGASSARVVSLGDNQVQSASWWGRLSVDDILKAVAIPTLLLLMGALAGLGVNAINTRRDARVHQNEAELSLRAETWKQMLPVSHNYAAKFYLPLSLAAEKFAKNLKKSKLRVAFFYLLLGGKKAIATRSEIGGFYFKDLRGEILAAQCWEKQRLACMGEEDAAFFLAVRASIDQLEDIDSYEAFEAMFADSPSADFYNDSIQQAWTHFQSWVADKNAVAKTISYLDSFTAVLDYESNRPYQYWYDQTKPRLVATEETEKILSDILTAEKYTPAEIAEYLAAAVRP